MRKKNPFKDLMPPIFTVYIESAEARAFNELDKFHTVKSLTAKMPSAQVLRPPSMTEAERAARIVFPYHSIVVKGSTVAVNNPRTSDRDYLIMINGGGK